MTIRILIGLLFFCSALQGFQLAGAGTGSRPEDAANRFESHGQSALQTLVNFGRETKTPLGVVLGDRALCDQEVDVMSEGDSAEVVIASILSTIPTYKWSVQDNVVVVEPREPVGPLAQLLQISIPQFAAPVETLQGQNISLWMFIHAEVVKQGGTGASVLSSADEQKAGPIEMRDSSVVAILNRIISREPKGLWIIPPLSEPLVAAIRRPVSKITTYGEPLPTPDLFVSCEPIR